MFSSFYIVTELMIIKCLSYTRCINADCVSSIMVLMPTLSGAKGIVARESLTASSRLAPRHHLLSKTPELALEIVFIQPASLNRSSCRTGDETFDCLKKNQVWVALT